MASDNLMIARRYLEELWSQGGLDHIEPMVAPDCTLRDPLFGMGTGPGQVRAQVLELRQAFPDLAFSMEEVIADAGDQLAVGWSMRGTHRGPLMGIPPTERAITESGILLMRVANGQLIAITSCWDPKHMLEQLGLVARAPDVDAVASAHGLHAPPRAPDGAAGNRELAPGRREPDRTTSGGSASLGRPPQPDIDGQWDM